MKVPTENKAMLGDSIEAALSLVGISSEKVEQWIGFPCGCLERKERLNQLGAWAKQALRTRRNEMGQILLRMIGPV